MRFLTLTLILAVLVLSGCNNREEIVSDPDEHQMLSLTVLTGNGPIHCSVMMKPSEYDALIARYPDGVPSDQFAKR